jgi:hypothetical protein
MRDEQRMVKQRRGLESCDGKWQALCHVDWEVTGRLRWLRWMLHIRLQTISHVMIINVPVRTVLVFLPVNVDLSLMVRGRHNEKDMIHVLAC